MGRRLCRVGIWLFIAAMLLGGCGGVASDLERFDGIFRTDCLQGGRFERSAAFARSKLGRGDRPARNDLLWALQLGCIERLRQDYARSVEYFDKAEQMLNYFDFENAVVDSAAATVVNDNVIPYTGSEYDGIMVNTYKALDFMQLGKNDLARVEFNRALDRQRRAREKFAAELRKVKKQLEQEQKKRQMDLKKSVENPQLRRLIEEKYPGLYEFEAYPDFVNPFATYVAGLFFALVGDYSKAVDLLKESYGMVSDNAYIGEDLELVERVLDGRARFEKQVWVIFENGLGPIKEEFRVDVPLFLATNKVKYIGIALPRLVLREQAYPYLCVRTTDGNHRTQLVADMDRVAQTEFNKDFEGILTRAIVSAAAKAAAQYVLAENDSAGAEVASVLVAVYSYATTKADLRIWSTLPKNFQVARLPIPPDRTVTIEPPSSPCFSVKIPPCDNALVYVRIPFAQGKPTWQVITY